MSPKANAPLLCFKRLKSLGWLKLVLDWSCISAHMLWSLARLARAVSSLSVKKLDATIFSAVVAQTSAMGVVLRMERVAQLPRHACVEEGQLLQASHGGYNHLAR